MLKLTTMQCNWLAICHTYSETEVLFPKTHKASNTICDDSTSLLVQPIRSRNLHHTIIIKTEKYTMRYNIHM